MKNSEIDLRPIQDQAMKIFGDEKVTWSHHKASVVARLVGENVANGLLPLTNGRTLKLMVNLAVGRIVGGIDPNSRVALGEIAQESMLEIQRRRNGI